MRSVTELSRIDYVVRSRMYNALQREENMVTQRIEEPRIEEIEHRLSIEINRLERHVQELNTNIGTMRENQSSVDGIEEEVVEMSHLVENELRSTVENLNNTQLNIVADAASSSVGGTGVLGIMLLGLGTGILLGGLAYYRREIVLVERENIGRGIVDSMILRGIEKLRRNKYIASGAAYLGLKWLSKIKK